MRGHWLESQTKNSSKSFIKGKACLNGRSLGKTSLMPAQGRLGQEREILQPSHMPSELTNYASSDEPTSSKLLAFPHLHAFKRSLIPVVPLKLMFGSNTDPLCTSPLNPGLDPITGLPWLLCGSARRRSCACWFNGLRIFRKSSGPIGATSRPRRRRGGGSNPQRAQRAPGRVVNQRIGFRVSGCFGFRVWGFGFRV